MPSWSNALGHCTQVVTKSIANLRASSLFMQIIRKTKIIFFEFMIIDYMAYFPCYYLVLRYWFKNYF